MSLSSNETQLVTSSRCQRHWVVPTASYWRVQRFISRLLGCSWACSKGYSFSKAHLHRYTISLSLFLTRVKLELHHFLLFNALLWPSCSVCAKWKQAIPEQVFQMWQSSGILPILNIFGHPAITSQANQLEVPVVYLRIILFFFCPFPCKWTDPQCCAKWKATETQVLTSMSEVTYFSGATAMFFHSKGSWAFWMLQKKKDKTFFLPGSFFFFYGKVW